MELKTTKRFVLKAHSEACDKWKKEIEKEFPEAFKGKLEVGKWYIGNVDFHSFINITNLKHKGDYYCIEHFGYTFQGEDWKESDEIHNRRHEKSLRLATPEEIETMLWKEAEKRGIGKDTKLEVSATGYMDNNNLNFDIKYSSIGECLWNKYGSIYHKGKWATPLNLNKKLKQQIKSLEQELKKLKERIK